MKYVAIFHANLNYAYLTPDRYEFVIREAYEMTMDAMRERFPGTKYVFEASGYTIDMMDRYAPDVVEKLKAAIGDGSCEFMGSPYAHPMLPNFPERDGLKSIEFSLRAYERVLGM
jgi:alpha-amylase/alpha-mannosidase (GH57 family)